MNWKDEVRADDAAARREAARDAATAMLPKWVQGHRMAKLGKAPDSEEYDADPELVDDVADAEVLTSWTGEREAVPAVAPNSMDWSALAHQPETYHRPILDLDMDAHLVPSSSSDHHHLYLDKVLKWSDYVKLLDVLAEVGIIEPGYRDASIAREFTAVRLPWIRKELPKDPTPEALTPEGDVHDPQRLCNSCDRPYGHEGRCGTPWSPK